MSTQTSYKVLCEVQLLHEYYLNFFYNDTEERFDLVKFQEEKGAEEINLIRQQLMDRYDVSNLFQIRLDPKTQLIMKKHRIFFRKTKTGFKLLTQAKGNKPSFLFPKELRLRFFLSIVHPQFYLLSDFGEVNFSPKSKMLYLHNKKTKKLGKNLILSKDNKAISKKDFLIFVEPAKDEKSGQEKDYYREYPHQYSDSAEENVFLPDSIFRDKVAGLIDIYHQPGKKDYSILSDKGEFKEKLPVFYAIFKRPEVVLRYHRFNEGKNTAYHEIKKQALIQCPLKNKHNNHPLPNSSLANLRVEEKTLYSDIYL